MVDQMWEDLDDALDDPGAPPECAARVRRAVEAVREFFPEVMEMTLEGLRLSAEAQP